MSPAPVADPVIHELPMRWADLDLLDHVNNVVYVDYAAESRAMLVEDGLLEADLSIGRMRVSFLRPLLLSRRPVAIVSTLDRDVLTQEICVDRDGTRTVFARIVTEHSTPQTLPIREASFPTSPSRVRQSDLGPDGAVTPVKVFELFQEGRVRFVADRLDQFRAGSFVVAQIDVTWGSPLAWRREPYDVRSWISHVGGSSMTIEAEIVDGARAHMHATSVLVGFDLAAQRSRKLAADERVSLEAISLPDSPSSAQDS